MKPSKFSDVKIVEIVRESRADGVVAMARKRKSSLDLANACRWSVKSGKLHLLRPHSLVLRNTQSTFFRSIPSTWLRRKA